jgi:polyisoprenoid-binding protein YceI
MAEVKYQIDPTHSSVHFSVRHMMISNVRGEFRKVSGTVTYDPDRPQDSTVEVTIDAASISTGDAQRDTHLRSADFLDVEQFPTITFRSKQITQSGDGGKVRGDLTVHGVIREVVLHVEGPSPEAKDPYGNLRIGASAATKISRNDFGLKWNSALETGGVLVGDELKIEIDAQAIRQ